MLISQLSFWLLYSETFLIRRNILFKNLNMCKLKLRIQLKFLFTGDVKFQGTLKRLKRCQNIVMKSNIHLDINA